MTIIGNEVAVDNQMRRAEMQSQSPVNRFLDGAESIAQAASIVTGSVAIGSIARTFGIARRFTSGVGVATLEENLDHLGDATEAALSRVEKNLDAQGVRIGEIERRLNSNELLEGIKAATLQAQRTKDKKRLERMALILANGVAEDDLEPETLDDMMRAAVELREQDIVLLKKIFESQEGIIRRGVRDSTNLYSDVQCAWGEFLKSGALRDVSQLEYRSSLARLESHGLIQQISASQFGIGQEPYMLLEEGAEFVKRINTIGFDQ